MMTIICTSKDKGHLSPQLQAVKLAFGQWRQDPEKSSRIPEQLWDQVIELVDSGNYINRKILTTLGISGSQLTKQLNQRQQATSNLTPQKNDAIDLRQNFVKAVVTPTPNEQVAEKQMVQAARTHHDIIITNPNGSMLQIQQLPYSDVLKLAEQFLR